MIVLKNFLRNTKVPLQAFKIFRRYASKQEKVFTVLPFCSVNINLPFNITMVPLDLHNYKDCDKIIVKLVNAEGFSIDKLQFTHDSKNVTISTNSNEFPQDTTCKIEAPIKANINIRTRKGNIGLLNFNGEILKLESENGNITASRCYCDNISITSAAGNIICTNVMQAAEIHLKTCKDGYIDAGRLQGLVLTAETENGNIKTESSYCNNSSFITVAGHLDLRSTHKECKVLVKNSGSLSMTGFDGRLQAEINDGNAEVQVSRIQGNSEIKVAGSGLLKLKLSEMCLENTGLKIIAKDVNIDKEFKGKVSNINGCTIIQGEHEDTGNILVDCRDGQVIVQNSSWMEMFNIKQPL